jgi:DNA (cytosine-5)-methyltransferase 1
MIKVSTFCSGIGSPEEALKELGVEFENVFYSEIDKYARITYEANHKHGFLVPDMTKSDYLGEKYYSDLNISGLPCQSFSLAGKRMGELDPRGLLFFNFYEYVKNQRPKVFIIENVKGLLSDNAGKTFANWLQLLGNTVNTQPVMFPHPDSLEYNLHWTVLNSKDFGVPQNRERVFLVGIRPDLPNTFRFPVGWPLEIRLRDILEENVPEKYFLSDKMVAGLIQHNENSKEKGRGFNFKPIDKDGVAKCIRANNFKMGPDDNYVVDKLTPFGTSQDQKLSPIDGISQTVSAGHFNQPKVMVDERIIQRSRGHNKGGTHEICPTISSNSFEQNNLVLQLNPSKESGGKQPYQQNRVYDSEGIMPALTSEIAGRNNVLMKKRIRRLTPREVFRLQGFSDSFIINAVSDSQAYKQAGNTITVSVIKSIIQNLLPVLE